MKYFKDLNNQILSLLVKILKNTTKITILLVDFFIIETKLQ